MPRCLKQFIYGFVYLLFIGLFGLGVYTRYFVTPPSCSDNIQNQQETDIDCGGPRCGTCELKHLSLKVGEPAFFDAGQFKTTAVVKITDPSLNYGSKGFNYEFQVINKFGGAIASRPSLSGTTYISAGETKYLIVPAIDIDPRDVGSVVVNIPNPTWELKESLPKFALSFNNLKTSVGIKSPQVTGNLKNDSATAYSSISLVGVVFDKFGTPLSASATELDNIPSFSETPFTIFYPSLPKASVIDPTLTSVSYEVSR